MPVANNTPGFTSFNDYLDANAGSLDAERGAALQGATAAGDKATGDLTALGTGAYNAGAKAATDAGPQDPHTSAAAPGFDPTTLGSYKGFIDDRKAAEDKLGALASGDLGNGYGAFEASMLGADPGYQGKAKALGDTYGKALSNYLGPLSTAYAGGYGSHVQYKQLEDPTADKGPQKQDPSNSGAYDDSGPRGWTPPGGTNAAPTAGQTDDSGVDRSGQQGPPTTNQSNPDEDPNNGTWGGGG